jgi:type IV pilus assembly protein PilC
MGKFSYKVRDREDRVLLGTMDAATEDEVLERLTQKALLPIQVKELSGEELRPTLTIADRFRENLKKSQNRVSYKSVVFFTRQLATMVGQGVPLSKCLDQLTRGEKPVFKKIITQVADDISTGFTLSDALARHPGAFSPMYVSVVHSGEVAGALDRVLDGLADYMESVEIMRGKVRTAMLYPTIIGGFVFLSLLLIMTMLVPTFENIYTGLGANLPLPTRILITVSHLVRQFILPILASPFALVIGFRFLASDGKVKKAFDKGILKVPVFGGILQKNIWATYSRTMSLLLGAGTPILKATEIAGSTISNSHFKAGLENVYSSLRKGELLSESLETSGLFPVLIIQLTATGESSGRVDALLQKAAEFYEREMRAVVDSLSTLIEPFLIVILGGLVGAVLLSLYLPIFKIGQYVR